MTAPSDSSLVSIARSYTVGRSVTRACLPGQNTLPLIARVFSDRILKTVGPFYPVSMPGEVKDPTRVI